MHIIALVESPDHVCCRYRLAAFRPFLERAGHSLQLLSWPRGWWSRLRLGPELKQADAVIIQRKLVPRWQLALLRSNIRSLIFDFDDAVFLRDSYAGKGTHCSRRLRAFRAMMRHADAVVGGNTFLCEHACVLARPETVRCIPTCVDPAQYGLAENARVRGSAELVWIGSSSTLRGLERIRTVLEAIGRSCPGVSLKLVCDRFLQFQSLPVVPVSWSEAGEAEALATADIGISWIPDDDWSRGKCGLKVLQYMAAGLPVVANPVGVQVDMVRHGENGFLAGSAEEWVRAISTLAGDPALRRRMGQAGRRRLESEFSVAHGAACWIELLDQLGQGRKAA